jgi:hypothetical protein
LAWLNPNLRSILYFDKSKLLYLDFPVILKTIGALTVLKLFIVPGAVSLALYLLIVAVPI